MAVVCSAGVTGDYGKLLLPCGIFAGPRQLLMKAEHVCIERIQLERLPCEIDRRLDIAIVAGDSGKRFSDRGLIRITVEQVRNIGILSFECSRVPQPIQLGTMQAKIKESSTAGH